MQKGVQFIYLFFSVFAQDMHLEGTDALGWGDGKLVRQ